MSATDRILGENRVLNGWIDWMKAVDRILGEAITPYQKGIYKNPKKALDWSLKNHRRFLEAEPYIAKDPHLAYVYASSVIGGRWPEAERESLVNHPGWSAHYAKDVIKGRWPEAEETIAKSEYNKDYYLKEWPEAKDDWVLNGWIDWLDT
jgi:hypothetical protein